MDAPALSWTFLAVMGSALACFVRAFAVRRDRPRHMRWALTGAAIDVLGTAVVLVTVRGLGWRVPARDPAVADVHRVLAYVATGMLFLQAGTGIAKARAHRFLGPVFLVVYAVTYAVAAAAYGPW